MGPIGLVVWYSLSIMLCELTRYIYVFVLSMWVRYCVIDMHH
jgi:hypothetical protein